MTLNTPILPEVPEDTLLLELERNAQLQEETNTRIAGATGILALGNIASRVLGLAREMVLTFLFGASALVDAFQVATVVIRAIYDLLIGGHVNGAIVPVLADLVTVHGRDELWRLLSVLMSLVMSIMTGLMLFVYIFAPQIVLATASGANAETVRLAVDLLRLTSPALIFMGLFAVFSATLYALKEFTLPAFAGVVFNGSIVIFTLLLTPPYQAQMSAFNATTTNIFTTPVVFVRPMSGIVAVAIGWLLGAVLQMAMQLWGLRGAKLHFTLDWRHPALRSIAILYAPVMLSLILDTLITRPYSYNLASRTGEGSIAYMNWATTLIQFPQGLVATAISIAILPTLAGQASQLTSATEKAFKDTLGLGLRLTTVLIMPATVGLFVLAIPIIQLLFQHGAFTVADTDITADALRLYLIGLPFAAIDLLIVYAFYARKDTLTPTLVGILSLGVYMLTANLLLPRYGLYSLMIADSVKHITHATVSAVLLRRRLGSFSEQRFVVTTVKTALASAVMAVVAILLVSLLQQHIVLRSFFQEAIFVGVASGLCLLVYSVMAYALHIVEFRWLMRLLRRRLGR